MAVLHFTTRVPDSRQVTITLPPDTPVGDALLTVTVAPSSVTYYRPADPAEAAEYDAFLRLLPALRRTHGHDYVAVSGGRVVAAGPDLGTVRESAGQTATRAAVYCGWVEPIDGYIPRSGKVVIVPAAGAGS